MTNKADKTIKPVVRKLKLIYKKTKEEIDKETKVQNKTHVDNSKNKERKEKRNKTTTRKRKEKNK